MKTYLVLCFVAVAQLLSAQVALKFNPEKGSKYDYNTTVVQKINMSVMGQNMETVLNVGILYDFVINDKTSEEVKTTVTYKEMSLNSQNPMMPMSYSSKTPKANPTEAETAIGKFFSAMIDVPIGITFAPEGKVKGVSGFEKIADEITKAMGSNAAANGMANMMKEQFSEEMMKQSMEQSFNVYPDKPVKIGDSWTKSASVPMKPLDIKSEIVYTLKSIDKNNALVGIAADLKMDSSPNTAASMNLKGTQTGTMTIDLKSGIIKSSEVTLKLSGTVANNPFEMDATSNLSITEKK